jgi:membrane-bound ClpP family serine protease
LEKEPTKLDLRIPMGSMFTLMGMILTVFGMITRGKETVYASSLGINANLFYGPALLIFGFLLLLPARMEQKKLEAASAQLQAKKAKKKR